MKINMIIHTIIAAIKLKLKKHRYKLTPSGDCQVRYYINKYINETKPDDYIEAYEENIERNKPRALQIEFYRNMSIDKNGKINPESLHFSAMMLSLVILLFAARNAEDYYALIEKESYRNMVRQIVDLVG